MCHLMVMVMLLSVMWQPTLCYPLRSAAVRQVASHVPRRGEFTLNESSRRKRRKSIKNTDTATESDNVVEKRSFLNADNEPKETPKMTVDSKITGADSVMSSNSYSNNKIRGVQNTNNVNEDGSNNLEDLFGLGNDQLRELNEQILPVPREDLVTRKEVKDTDVKDENKVFKLPDLTEFMQQTGGKRDADKEVIIKTSDKIDRKNQEEYIRVLQLNPFADADESMFLDEYDIIPSIVGSGKLLNIPVPYLQTGHGILLIITLLASFIYAPGNPLTEFPLEIRQFLRTGLFVTYSINAVLAAQAFFIAKSKNLPAVFWALKVLLVGGISFYEINQAKDPSKLNDDGVDPSIRKSRR